uniref:Reverse transcriptase domain-containing protein n=1 Tax=Lactuca sativa TaxID=4236 RepID=A0A9R1VIP8_LACSA|nr:hypothetical protein LSAT_V11C500267880 [Lactuca sativa]
MEGLNAVTKNASAKGIFDGVQLPNNGPMISYLFCADDTLFIGEWSKRNIINLARILRCFHAASGLKVKFHKSKVFGIGASSQETSIWAHLLGCEPSPIPFNYLGVPVAANMNIKSNLKPIIERFQAKLSDWKAKNLSFRGRLLLIHSVFGNLPTYYLSLFIAPAGVISQLEKLRCRFLWGGSEDNKKISWVLWSKITKDKEDGGLGVGAIEGFNISLIFKWWWRLKIEKE